MSAWPRADWMRQTSPSAASGPSDSTTRPMSWTTRPHVSVTRVSRTRRKARCIRLLVHGRVGVMALKKAPSSNIQAPEKSQAPNAKRRCGEHWCLEFGASLELGAWMLELSCVQRLPQLFNFCFAARVNQAEARLDDAAAAPDFGRVREPQRPGFRQASEDFCLMLSQQCEIIGMQLNDDFRRVLRLAQRFAHGVR